MFERFTEKAIKVIMLAQEEARRWVITSWALSKSFRSDWRGNWGCGQSSQVNGGEPQGRPD
jgi:hypothetical protein